MHYTAHSLPCLGPQLTVEDMREAYPANRKFISGRSQPAVIEPQHDIPSQYNLVQTPIATVDTKRPAHPSRTDEHSEDNSESSGQAQDDSDTVDESATSDTEGSSTVRPPKSPSPSPSPGRQAYRSIIGDDPLSFLSSLERTVLIAVHDNASLYPGGVPITLIAQNLFVPLGPSPDDVW